MTVLSLVYAVATAIYAVMAVIVILRNPRAVVNWHCGLVLVCFVIWTPYGIFHHLQPPIQFAEANLVYRIGKVGANWVTSVWLLFSLALTNRKKYLRAWPIYIPILGIPLALSIREWYGPVVGTLVLGHNVWGSNWELSFWSVLYVVDYLTTAILGLYLVARFGRHATQKRQRRQALVTFSSAAVTLVGSSLFDVVWPIWTGNPVPEMAQLVGLSWAVGLFITVTRYGLTTFTVQAAADKILATMPDVLLLLDTDGKVVTSNQALVDVLGHDRRALHGSSAAVLFDRPGDFESLLGRLQREHHLPGLEAFVRHRDGGQIPISVTARTMLLGDGALRGSVWVLRDVTARHEAEQRQAQLLRQLEAANQELADFAHVVAHDLKNPLCVVLGFAGPLTAADVHLSDKEVSESLQAIGQSARKMNSIIDELLLLAEVREAEVERQPVETAAVVSGALQRLSYMTAEYAPEIVMPDAWPVAFGHGPWIEEVWANYLSNAIKYGGKPPRLELGAETIGDDVRFWVADNGPGLTPEQQARLFTPFTRLHQVRATGQGLGLSIVRRIMEKLGGRAWVESKPGEGSTFYFTLPTAAVVSQAAVSGSVESSSQGN